ncbi:MAG: hypothetical protein UU42_C0022G0001 [Candidatus Woesebacteria bacterium GW2011_GWA1_41_13b]|uniref:KTSC domain-containing protein n=1 Tax=Candidatus Woesebacteria bacterium GW2011_GWA1_41_13b TaxID=1618555 RepID=A0A0G0UQU3_9BACT|nr:MAG: hypothetical protein UU42_C0022G0001 [Candidatus Woesebacteria bacterium GW2011_GWA1_41_13b]
MKVWHSFMEPYRDWDNDSNIVSFEIGDGYITVEFRTGRFRFYTYSGSYHVSEMQRLARLGDGLNAYINNHKPPYSSKR